MRFHFPIVIIDEDFRAENVSGSEIRALAAAREADGAEVAGITSFGDARSFARQHSRSGAFILSIDDEEFEDITTAARTMNGLREFVREIRHRNPLIPIFLYGETRTSRHITNDVLKELHGFIHMFEDTPEFVARRIAHESNVYLNRLAPPFFRALIDYAADGSYSWHCPGHSGGVAFLKSPVGQMFHQFFGENLLRADVSTSVDELGQLLDHTGPIAESERNAARIFGCDHLFFVTNGTSTSNKIVWHSVAAPGDIVIVDRNCHKSVLHAIIMTRTVPIFLTPTRNHYGIIGPIAREAFEYENLQAMIRANPFAAGRSDRPRLLAITQSTYDGILYNVDTIKRMLDGKVDVIHFDEAWLPHAAFHDLYESMHAIGNGTTRWRDSMVFATQSTHKLLASLSQASQILVRDSDSHNLDRESFNEAFLMHTSTSPQYAIIASCDVAAAMMEPPAGTALVEEAINEALDFRRAMRQIAMESGDGWWFRVWGPDALAEDGIGTRADWLLDSREAWHGFGSIATGFNMLDPIKVTILTPGIDIDGNFSGIGIPAAVVTKYLAQHGIVVEKTGLYSFFVMFTIGITKGRWNTLVTSLQQFRDDFENDVSLCRALPDFVVRHAQYRDMSLRELCMAIHDTYHQNDVARLTMAMYSSLPVPAMIPADAYAKIAHAEVEHLDIELCEGRVAASLLTPYPPGIPLLVPGERFNWAIVQFLRFSRTFNERFPGFETDIHGLTQRVADSGVRFYVDCLLGEGGSQDEGEPR